MWVKELERLLTRVRPYVRDETLRKLLTERDQLLLFARSPFPASSTCCYSLNFIRLRTIPKLKIFRGSSRQSRIKQVWCNWSSGLPLSRHLNPKLFQLWRQRKCRHKYSMRWCRWSSDDLLGVNELLLSVLTSDHLLQLILPWLRVTKSHCQKFDKGSTAPSFRLIWCSSIAYWISCIVRCT